MMKKKEEQQEQYCHNYAFNKMKKIISNDLSKDLEKELSNRLEKMRSLIQEDNKQLMDNALGRIKGIMSEIGESHRKIMEDGEKFKKDIKAEMINMFDSLDFLTSFKNMIFRAIDEQVRVVLSDEGADKIITEKLNKIVHSNIQESIHNMTESIVKTLVKKLNYEMKAAKQLTYSIDSEIKHCLQHAPISYEDERNCRTKIMSILDKIEMKDNKLVIESKRGVPP